MKKAEENKTQTFVCTTGIQFDRKISIIFDENSQEVQQKYRDVLKQCVLKENEQATYIILGIEDQTDIHYAMPVKNLIYDAMHYGKQVSQTGKKHRDTKELKGAEFLSGFAKSDHLKPVVTLTIYFGAQKWDAPRALSEMFEEIPPEILKYTNDYRLNLIVPEEIKDFAKFSSELRNVLQFIAGSNDVAAIRQFARDDSFSKLHRDTVQLINECTNIKIPISEGEQEVNVCKGLEDYAAEVAAEAAIHASIEAWQDVNIPKEEILSRIMQKYQLDEKTAADYYEGNVM